MLIGTNTMKLLRSAALAAAFASAAGGAALAHHGWSSYLTDAVVVSGPVRASSWGSPHGSIDMDHAGKRWTIVLAPVSRMQTRGLTEPAIAVGQTVKVEAYPKRDGTAEMRAERITAGGKTVELR